MANDFEIKAAALNGEITALKHNMREYEVNVAASAHGRAAATSTQADFIRDLRRQHEQAIQDHTATKAMRNELKTQLDMSTFKLEQQTRAHDEDH